MNSTATEKTIRIEVSVIVPLLNEADNITYLLDALHAQTYTPREVILVDGGSTDGTGEKIQKWIQAKGTGNFRLISSPGGFPGGNRNRGVAEAVSDWVAFIDAGITPTPSWLESLFRCASDARSRAVLGYCHFDGITPFEKAVCALSYGANTHHPVLPASLFHRSVFEIVGVFREDLRSAEDLLWLRQVRECLGGLPTCAEALVFYRYFPDSLAVAARKWWIYEQNSVLAGIRGFQQWILTAYFASAIGLISWYPLVTFTMIIGYGAFRGVLDPMRRSKRVRWWADMPRAALIAVGLGLVLDISKTAGGLVQRIQRLISKRDGRDG